MQNGILSITSNNEFKGFYHIMENLKILCTLFLCFKMAGGGNNK